MKEEQRRQGMVLDDVQLMLQQLMLCFPPPEWGIYEFTPSCLRLNIEENVWFKFGGDLFTLPFLFFLLIYFQF